LQLIASPWVVMPRLTWRPIEAILRAGVDDGVRDQLAGAVVGDQAAAVGVVDFDALGFVPVDAHRQLLGRGAAAANVGGGLL
jgi:hypothetical protein